MRSSPTRPACGTRTRARPSSTTCPTTSRRRRTSPPTIRRRSRSSRTCSGRRPSGTRCCRCSPTLSTFFGLVPPIPEDTTFEFRGDVQNVLSGMIPRIYNRSYSITADLVVPEGGAEGVIVAEADHLGGFTLYVKDGKLTHTYSMMGVFVFKQVAEENLPSGDVTVRMEFEADERQAGDGRRGDAVHRRPTGRQGADGPHGADPLLGLRGDGHRPRQRRRRRPRATRTRSRSRSPAR